MNRREFAIGGVVVGLAGSPGPVSAQSPGVINALVGPSGGLGGENEHKAAPATVRGIKNTLLIVSYTAYRHINALTLHSRLPDGSATATTYSGRQDFGDRSVTIDLSSRSLSSIQGLISGLSGEQPRLTGLNFELSDGTKTEYYGRTFDGRNLNRTFRYDIPQGYVLTGFFGYTGDLIDSLGFQFSSA